MQVKSVYDRLTIAIRNMRNQLKELENLISSSQRQKRDTDIYTKTHYAADGSMCSECRNSDSSKVTRKFLHMKNSFGLPDGQNSAHAASRFARDSRTSGERTAQMNSLNSRNVQFSVVQIGNVNPDSRLAVAGEANPQANSGVATNFIGDSRKPQSESQMFGGFNLSGNHSFYIK